MQGNDTPNDWSLQMFVFVERVMLPDACVNFEAGIFVPVLLYPSMYCHLITKTCCAFRPPFWGYANMAQHRLFMTWFVLHKCIHILNNWDMWLTGVPFRARVQAVTWNAHSLSRTRKKHCIRLNRKFCCLVNDNIKAALCRFSTLRIIVSKSFFSNHHRVLGTLAPLPLT